MEFTNTFHVPLPLEEAWPLMLDVPRILPCLPGARLTEVLGNDRYKGSVSVRLGPIRLTFDGQATMVRRDDENHVAWLEGSGSDPKGRGSAQSEFSFALTPAADGGTRVTVTTRLALAGSVAQYGRGSGMIAEVASQILRQFEENLARSLAPDAEAVGAEGFASLAQDGLPGTTHGAAYGGPEGAALHASAPGAAGAMGGGAAAPRFQPEGGPASGQAIDAQTVLLQAQAVLGQAQAILALAQSRMVQSRRGVSPGAASSGEINMLKIGLKAIWARIRYSVAGLFGRRT